MVIPCIYDNNGVVEKIIVDGIICIFGRPFIKKNISHCIYYAFQYAKDIIKKTTGTVFQSKIALHAGELIYFHNKTGQYEEFTVVGKPLTDLFRLEGISEDNCINHFDNSIVRYFFKLTPEEIVYWKNGKPAWPHISKEIVPPKGTNYNQIFRIIKAK